MAYRLQEARSHHHFSPRKMGCQPGQSAPQARIREMAEELERARKAVRELSRTLKSLPKEPPPGEVHRLRTTTRRVEAIVSVMAQLEGKESRRLLKSIEPIRKAAGGVREMDVLIGNARRLARYLEGDSLARLVEQLHIARQQNAEELRRVLGRRRTAARKNLKDYSSLIRQGRDSRGRKGIDQRVGCPLARRYPWCSGQRCPRVGRMAVAQRRKHPCFPAQGEGAAVHSAAFF